MVCSAAQSLCRESGVGVSDKKKVIVVVIVITVVVVVIIIVVVVVVIIIIIIIIIVVVVVVVIVVVVVVIIRTEDELVERDATAMPIVLEDVRSSSGSDLGMGPRKGKKKNVESPGYGQKIV
nr:hypothetical protein BaRGS_034275 [Batillaria attramentaria]